MAFNSNSDNCNFGFAFNDPIFSNRMLLIEVMADSEIETCGNAEWGTQILKWRRENGEGSSGTPHKQRDEATKSCDAMRSTEAVHRVETIHINSAILAAKSPFFYKLFSKESEERTSTLQIRAKEEAALMDLLNFIYSDTLLTTTPSVLEDILLVADKFEVVSCIRYCSQQLSSLPMTSESALQYLDLTSRILRANAVQTLTDTAKQFLAAQFKDINRFQDEVLELPLSGFEAVLSSNELQACSEDLIYDVVLKYAARHYQRMEDRKEMLDTHLRHLIRFPYMSTWKLQKVLTSRNFSSEVICKVVMEALFFKTDPAYRHRMLASTRSQAAGQTRVNADRFVERAYKHRPVTSIEMERPRHHCVAYLDLKREECMNLFPAGKVYSQIFHLGSHRFFLSAHCNMNHENTTQCFGLFICMQNRESAGVEANYEFAARMKPEEEFETKYNGNYVFTGGRAVGVRNLFVIPWSEFIGKESVYFINGILHLRAVVTIKQ